MRNDYFKVGSFQGNGLEKNPGLALEKILQVMEEADDQGVDILCTPESYLHGYLKTKEEALEYSVDLQSSAFADICLLFKNFETTLLLGLNERMGSKLYNTTVVIEQSKCLGAYRKANTYAPYDYFSLGNEFPIFKKDNIPYGIVICCDINFIEPARILALKGAKILFCPMWNRISKDAKMLASMHQKSHFMGRAYDNRCWVVTSDIVWDEKDAETCPGYSCIISNRGEVLTQAEPFSESLLTYSIPKVSLLKDNDKHLKGNEKLFEQMVETYNQRFSITERA